MEFSRSQIIENPSPTDKSNLAENLESSEIPSMDYI
jgi:hypothetical protein